MAGGGRTVDPRTSPLDDPWRLAEPELELSIVMPCLNERDSVGACIGKAPTLSRDRGGARRDHRRR
jgi:hypothetical protein